jgi:hypothetical protein
MRRVNTYFSEIGHAGPRPPKWKPFKVYTGNEELYEYVKQLFIEVAGSLRETAVADKWETK